MSDEDFVPDVAEHIEPEDYALDEEPVDNFSWFLSEKMNSPDDAPPLDLILSPEERSRNPIMADVIEGFPALFRGVDIGDIKALFAPIPGKTEDDRLSFPECLQWIREKRSGNALVAEIIRQKLWSLSFKNKQFETYYPTAEEVKRNPIAGILVRSIPEIFEGFTEADWKDVYSLPMTADMNGVVLLRSRV